MSDCFYCENGEKRKSLMIEICKLKYSTIYLNKDQKHLGRVVVMFNEHKTEYFQLTEEENAGYFAELSIVAKAIYNLYEPDKINYATFGDNVPHVHIHVVPKYKDGLNWGEPFDDTLDKHFLTDNQYDKIKSEILAEIEKEYL
ncbi:MAG: HIT family protein [Spirochaetales bacterium]